jgi:hypothetical protein
MSVQAQIQFTQGATVGTSGQALFGVTGTGVVVSNGQYSAQIVRSTFTVLAAPGGSSIAAGVLQDGPLPTVTFTPDVQDGYTLQLTVYDALGNSATDVRVFGVQRMSGRFIPPQYSTDLSLNFSGQPRGWALYMEQWLRYLDGLSVGGQTSTFICDPTVGSPSGNVYNTFASAVAAANALNGAACSIFIRTTTICTTAVNLQGIELYGPPVGLGVTPTTLAFQAGASVTAPWRNIHDLFLDCNGAGPFQTLSTGQVITIGQFVTTEMTAGEPFWTFGAGTPEVIMTIGAGSVIGDGTNPVITGTGALEALVFDGGTLAANATAASVTLIVGTFGGSYPTGPQVGSASFASVSPYARGWADATGNVLPGTTAATIACSVTVTPGATGKFRVSVTGTFVNVSATSDVLIASNLSHGSGVTTSDYNGPAAYLGSNGAVGSLCPFAITVDYDKSSLVGPIVFPVGVPVTFNFVITLGSATANVGITTHGVQIAVEEKP